MVLDVDLLNYGSDVVVSRLSSDADVDSNLKDFAKKIRSGADTPEKKMELALKVKSDLVDYRKDIAKSVNDSNSAIAKDLFKNMDDLKSFGDSLKRNATYISEVKFVYELAVKIQSLRTIERASKNDFDRLEKNPNAMVMVVDVNMQASIIAQSFSADMARLQISKVDVEQAKNQMDNYNNAPDMPRSRAMISMIESDRNDEFSRIDRNNPFFAKLNQFSNPIGNSGEFQFNADIANPYIKKELRDAFKNGDLSKQADIKEAYLFINTENYIDNNIDRLKSMDARRMPTISDIKSEFNDVYQETFKDVLLDVNVDKKQNRSSSLRM